jgi:8-oxo-dGTP diphosphatase
VPDIYRIRLGIADSKKCFFCFALLPPFAIFAKESMHKDNMGNKVYTYKHPHPSVTVDCVIFGFDGASLQVLLIERGAEPFKGCWAFPGGFLNMDESAAQGAMRELEEETGLTGAYMEQFHTYSAPDRDPRERVITIAHYALVRTSEVRPGDDASRARWFSLNEVPPLAFDHARILKDALTRLRERIHFHPVAFGLLPKEFTMKELRSLYEAVFCVSFDHRSFGGRMLRTGLLVKVAPASGHKSSVYRFDTEKYEELRRNGIFPEF